LFESTFIGIYVIDLFSYLDDKTNLSVNGVNIGLNENFLSLWI